MVQPRPPMLLAIIPGAPQPLSDRRFPRAAHSNDRRRAIMPTADPEPLTFVVVPALIRLTTQGNEQDPSPGSIDNNQTLPMDRRSVL